MGPDERAKLDTLLDWMAKPVFHYAVVDSLEPDAIYQVDRTDTLPPFIVFGWRSFATTAAKLSQNFIMCDIRVRGLR